MLENSDSLEEPVVGDGSELELAVVTEEPGKIVDALENPVLAALAVDETVVDDGDN